jgi:hypothetical protein
VIATLVILVALFFAARALGLRGGLEPRAAAGIAVALCIAFVAGSLAHPIVIGSTAPPASASATATALPPLGPGVLARLVARHDFPGLGSVDVIDVAADHSKALVRGWVADPETRGPARGAILLVDGHIRYDATPVYGQSRPDVAAVIASAPAEFTGFSGAEISLRGLAKGKHFVQCASITKDGLGYELVPRPLTFTV